MTSEFHQFKLRIPIDLMEQLESAAETSGRSLSAEIVFRLTSTLESPIPVLIANRLREKTLLEHAIAERKERFAAIPSDAEDDLESLGNELWDLWRQLMMVNEALKALGERVEERAEEDPAWRSPRSRETKPAKVRAARKG